MKIYNYENIKIEKYGSRRICMQKNIDVKKVKDYVKKVNTYKKPHKVTNNRNVKEEASKPKNEKKNINATNTQKCIYVYIHKHENIQIY